MSYYYAGRSGDPFVGETLHSETDCVDGSMRPLADSTVERVIDEVTFCPDCTTRGDSDGGEDSEMRERDVAQLIDAGECPWCGGEYANVASHASQIHSEEWEEHNTG